MWLGMELDILLHVTEQKRVDMVKILFIVFTVKVFTLKKTLWKHIKICPEKTREDTPQAGRKRVRSLCALATPVGLEVSEGLQKILAHANFDEVSHVVQSDKCILQLGQLGL